ncbi:hypothetical protein C8J55DRAFT_564241 [Lentinula edodes]|uniref:Uncharacterized protein n=1 Tax=Lentinula lateritia TaxID=40482 RepID=A0A9W9DGX0_9AGAR|nr:hypothetical protein C8J55DRAFT_564241 [Lentinula edodes]
MPLPMLFIKLYNDMKNISTYLLLPIVTAVAPLHLHSFAPGPLAIAIGGLAAFVVFRVFVSGGSKLPPGPSRIPVFGGAFGSPADYAWHWMTNNHAAGHLMNKTVGPYTLQFLRRI